MSKTFNRKRKGYGSTPSWWNRLFHTKPARKKDNVLCTKIKNYVLLDEFEEPDFSVYKKPHKDYW